MRNGTSVISVLAGRGRLGVEPPSVTTFYAMSTAGQPTLWKSKDGGMTWASSTGGYGASIGGRLCINPNGYMISYNLDGNVSASNNYGRTWTSLHGTSAPGGTSNVRPQVVWSKENNRFVISPYNNTSGGRRHYVSVAGDLKPTSFDFVSSPNQSSTSSLVMGPGNFFFVGSPSSNSYPQLEYSRNGTLWSIVTNSFAGTVGIEYSPKLNKVVALGYGISTANAKVAIINPDTGRLDNVFDTPVFENQSGLFFWSAVLERFVRTNFNTINNHVSSRYISVSEDAVNWETLDLGVTPGVQRGWAESNNELVMFTTNSRVVVIRSLTDFNVVTVSGLNAYGGTCFVPQA